MKVKDLRRILDRMEAEWDETQERYLGPFAEQVVYVDSFKDGRFAGFASPDEILYDATLGVMILHEEKEAAPPGKS